MRGVLLFLALVICAATARASLAAGEAFPAPLSMHLCTSLVGPGQQADRARAERSWARAGRALQKELRKSQPERAQGGWFDGTAWQDYDGHRRAHRTSRWEAIRHYRAPRRWRPPEDWRAVAYAPGMHLPRSWYRVEYRLDPAPYGLPPPPPRHQWVQVDNDAVLVALATGMVADFVYDIFR